MPPTGANGAIRCAHFLSRVRLEDGGVARAVLDWCGVLATRGHAVTLLTSDATDVPLEWHGGAPGNPKLVTLAPPGRGGLLGRNALATASTALAAVQVLHLHGPWEPANLQLARMARRVGVPYVVSAHGMLDDWSMAQRALKKRVFLRLFGRRFLERAARVHCTAEAELEQARRHFPAGRAVVAPYVFDLAPFRNLPDPAVARAALPEAFAPSPGPAAPDADGAKILFLSRVHPKKGVELLIRAAAMLRAAALPFTVLIAGPGPDDYVAALRAQARELGVEDRVRFLGMVRGDAKLALYQASRVFVLPTSQENFGIVLPEAMACGTPVITTRGVDIWRELASGGAVIVDADPRAIADAVRPFLADADHARRVGERGRQWVFDHLAIERVAGQYESLYRAVAQEAGRARAAGG